ncbi:DUF2591 family protein [Paraburkholderia sp. UCT2]|uniref:DUF2591 family protein n=1 Tax=Paraburkholderia sp. UCT2 TaxID=2615208 RepID=UPI001655B8C8|nr:DUF2591 family protein [Paraburkholderia sp. UCT2]
MNVVELTGADLDYWVARAEGYDAEVIAMHGWRYCRIDVPYHGYQVYGPTQNELLAARIMQKHFYTVGPAPLEDQKKHGGALRVWMAEAQMNPSFHDLFMDDSPWIAICRLRVAEALSQRGLVFAQYEQWQKKGRSR